MQGGDDGGLVHGSHRSQQLSLAVIGDQSEFVGRRHPFYEETDTLHLPVEAPRKSEGQVPMS